MKWKAFLLSTFYLLSTYVLASGDDDVVNLIKKCCHSVDLDVQSCPVLFELDKMKSLSSCVSACGGEDFVNPKKKEKGISLWLGVYLCMGSRPILFERRCISQPVYEGVWRGR